VLLVCKSIDNETQKHTNWVAKAMLLPPN